MATIDGRISPAGDKDRFDTRLDGGLLYAIWVTGRGGNPLEDASLKVSRGGTVVARDDDSGPGLDPQIFLRPGSTGSYKIEVSGYRNLTGDYRLVVARDDFRNVWDGPGPAGLLQPGQGGEGRINYANDTDIINTPLVAGLTYRFDMKGASTNSGGLRDPELVLSNPNGRIVATDDDSGTGLNAQFWYRAGTTGRFHMEAEGNGGTGSYWLKVGFGRASLDADRVAGTAFADKIDGAAGDDHIRGGAGVDLLKGGAGADRLTGGAGDDLFIFTAVRDSHRGAVDTITDFHGAGEKGGDIIDLSRLGDLTLADGRGPGHVWLRDAGDTTVLRADVDGDGRADFILHLADGARVAAADYHAGDFLL